MERKPRSAINIGDGERALTLLLGGTLIVRALARPSAWSVALGVGAGLLTYRALRGYCPLYRARGLRSVAESGDAPGRTTSPCALVVDKSVSIQRPPAEVYRFWRCLDNLPRFMARVQAIEVGPDGTSHWTVTGPAGTHLEWDARITEDVPDERLAWSTREGSDGCHEGLVCFTRAPGGRGTEVRVRLRYEARGGKLGALVARVFGEDPSQQVQDDLRRLKQIMETGEVATAARRRA